MQNGQPNIQNAPVFYTGIVEDNNDPQKMGRCRVRLVGLHTENKTELPTASLPWADLIQSPVGNISEVGAFTVPEQGSWVVCAFHDIKFQRPFILGTLPRIESSTPTFSDGFTDPAQVYPIAANKGRTSISKVATGETGVLSNKPTNITGTLIVEPVKNASYVPVYPKNKVIQSASGHIIEIDDTSGKERVEIMHKTGTFIEMLPTGEIVIHTKAAQYLVSDTTLNIYGTGNVNIESAANIKMKAATNIEMTAGGDILGVSGSNINMTAPTRMLVTSPLLQSTVEIKDMNGVEASMNDMRGTFNAHVHSGVQTGAGNTGIPTTQMDNS